MTSYVPAHEYGQHRAADAPTHGWVTEGHGKNARRVAVPLSLTIIRQRASLNAIARQQVVDAKTANPEGSA